MPTPFYHLCLAEELINHPRLSEKVSNFLRTRYCEFLFGNTAPDVQVISGQPRQNTHFFSLPIQNNEPVAWELILSQYPRLEQPDQLPASQAAFLAGYLCHLQADWLWVKDIFTPYFGPRCEWDTFKERLYYHNVLRAYLDLRILPELQPGMDACLGQVEPQDWLPFVWDQHLLEWRDLLIPQLHPGAATQTVEVFALRQGIAIPEFYAVLCSEERMHQEVFTHLPLELVQSYRQQVVEANLQLLVKYLAFTLRQMDIPIDGSVIKGAQL